jgi:hypothetical protein
MGIAIRQARENGLLGEDILGTGFDFDLEIANQLPYNKPGSVLDPKSNKSVDVANPEGR